MSYITWVIHQSFLQVTRPIEYVADGVIDAFDTFLYYIMNAMVLIQHFFEMVGEFNESVSHNMGIVAAGYKNGFINNIN